MKTFNKFIALFGEKKAKHYLVKKGYKILNTNWSLKYGELDIVALDKNELVIIEVKSRKAAAYKGFSPADAVTFKKINKIKMLSGYYFDRNKTLLDKLNINRIRYDVIGVSIKSPWSFHIEHRTDAF